jgi:hypothetical protein
MYARATINGIEEHYCNVLEWEDITSADILLKKCATKKDRMDLSEKTDISEKQLLSWANRADILRIKDISEDQVTLLAMAGVDTRLELIFRDPAILHKQLTHQNRRYRLIARSPSLHEVEGWIFEAGNLPSVISY